MKTMENETTKAVWQKPEIIDLDLELTHGKSGGPVEDIPPGVGPTAS